MSFTIISSDVISDNDDAVPVTADEYLQIAAGARVIANNGHVALALQGSVANGAVDVEGYVGGYDGLKFLFNTGNETVTVGPGGSIVAQDKAVYLQAAVTGYSQQIDNAGYIYGYLDGLYLVDGGEWIHNSGRIGGDVAIDLHSGAGDTIINDATGVINGRIGVKSAAYGQQITNAGAISTYSATGHALELDAGSCSIVNSGAISGVNSALYIGGGGDSIQNSGLISVTGSRAIDIAGDNIFVENSGKISAVSNDVFIAGTSAGIDWIVNDAGATITSENQNYAIYVLSSAAHIVNYGDVNGAIYANGPSTFANTGEFNGEATFGAGVRIRNTGTMTYDFTGPAGGADLYISGIDAVDDRFVNTASGVLDATGAVALYHTAPGTFRVVNHGEILGDSELLGQATVVNAGTVTGNVLTFSGGTLVVNRGIIDGSVIFNGSGDVYRGLAGEVTGTILGGGPDGRYLGGAHNDTFDMSVGGAKYVSGGAGDDLILFKSSNLTSQTVVVGGAGDDALSFTTAGAIAATAFLHVSGVETINLASGNNAIALSGGLVDHADGGSLAVNGSIYLDTIDASAVTNAADRVTMYGGTGPDTLIAGGAQDVFLYTAVKDSTGVNYDTIVNANLAADRFDVSGVAGSILAVNPALTTGSLSTSTFSADLVADLPAAKLGSHDAVLFTASGGTLAGQTFLVIDVNGTAGYQTGADLVIRLTGATGALTTGNFI